MLTVDPAKRLRMEDLLESAWLEASEGGRGGLLDEAATGEFPGKIDAQIDMNSLCKPRFLMYDIYYFPYRFKEGDSSRNPWHSQ